MANLIIQENGVARTTPAVHGEEITIQAPCDCSAVTGVQIADVIYPFYDAAGNVLPMGTGLFTEGNLIRVLIDTVNGRATIINHAVTAESIGAGKVEAVSYVGTGTWGKSAKTSVTFSFAPSAIVIFSGAKIHTSSYSDTYTYYIICCAELTESGTYLCRGIPYDGATSVAIYIAKSADGKTINLYADDKGTHGTLANHQANATDTTYTWVGLA